MKNGKESLIIRLFKKLFDEKQQVKTKLTKEEERRNIDRANEMYEADKKEMDGLERKDAINNELWLNNTGG